MTDQTSFARHQPEACFQRKMEYAAVEIFPVDLMLHLHRDMGTRKVPYAFGLLKRGREVVIIDIPYNHKEYGKLLADSCGVSNWHGPRAVMSECGVAPEDVTAVFITHAHFDHIGTAVDWRRA